MDYSQELFTHKRDISHLRKPGDSCLIHLTVAFLLVLLIGSTSAADKEHQRLKVFVSILPQAYFVERVGGRHVDIEVMVGPGQSPAVYEPTPKQMTLLAQSDVYFRIGVPFEDRLLNKASGTMGGLNIVDTRRGIRLRYMEASRRQESSGQGRKDPHTWLDPELVKIQSKNICEELKRLDSLNAPEFEENLRVFHSDLDSLDGKIARVLAPLEGREFFIFHPTCGYFADRYGLKQVPIETEGKEPSARQISSLIEKAGNAKIRCIFIQPQFSAKGAEAIARAIGGTVVEIDALARDYLRNLEDIANALAEGLKSSER